mmetsp:Transcript_60205/g.158343  ORF Transcript_60205/g.158343 Transcript_60205/m.158343 type:complete len:441 (+) Transcript_60205:161-1483(+)
MFGLCRAMTHNICVGVTMVLYSDVEPVEPTEDVHKRITGTSASTEPMASRPSTEPMADGVVTPSPRSPHEALGIALSDSLVAAWPAQASQSSRKGPREQIMSPPEQMEAEIDVAAEGSLCDGPSTLRHVRHGTRHDRLELAGHDAELTLREEDAFKLSLQHDDADISRPLESLPEEVSKDLDALTTERSANLEAENLYPRIGLLPRPGVPPAASQQAEEEESIIICRPGRTSGRAAEKASAKSRAPSKGRAAEAELRTSGSRLSVESFYKKKPQPAPEPSPMHLRPALKSRVILDRGEDMTKLGLDMTEFITKEEGALRIEEVGGDGLVESWNKTHRNREILAGDYIVEVNGVRGNPRHLLEAITQDRIVDMMIKRVVQPTRIPFPGEGVPGAQKSSLLRRWSSRVSTNSGSSRTTTATTASGLSRLSLQFTDEVSTPSA